MKIVTVSNFGRLEGSVGAVTGTAKIVRAPLSPRGWSRSFQIVARHLKKKTKVAQQESLTVVLEILV